MRSLLAFRIVKVRGVEANMLKVQIVLLRGKDGRGKKCDQSL